MNEWYCCTADYPNHDKNCPNREGKMDEKVICPQCSSADKVEKTCNTFEKGEEPKWTGWYCCGCGYWWKREEKMDEKIKEIEERWDYPNADKLDWNNAKDDIDCLLSLLKEERVEKNRFKNERDDLRKLHDDGIREAYRICGVEDDGEYRWKWVLLELSSRVTRIKELELDLTVNASMLAKQCDHAREAETKVKKLEMELRNIKIQKELLR